MFTLLSLALGLAQPGEAHVVESWTVEMTEPLNGPDFQLILEAFKHPEIRNRDLSCYKIRVFREKGVRRVAFVGERPPVREVDEGDRIAIIYPKPNPRCTSRSFEMDDKGKVRRVIYERH